jgi:hypothetical protein
MGTEDGAKALHVYVDGLRQDRWDADYRDAIGQHAWLESDQWPMEQVAAFMMVHHLLMEGEFAQITINVGHEPQHDGARAANREALRELPDPFVATVDQTQGTSSHGDGWLRWTESIRVMQSLGVPFTDLASGHMAPVRQITAAPPKHVPLEIGTTLPSKTWEHLRGWGVARWPYNSEVITLFVRMRFPRATTGRWTGGRTTP